MERSQNPVNLFLKWNTKQPELGKNWAQLFNDDWIFTVSKDGVYDPDLPWIERL